MPIPILVALAGLTVVTASAAPPPMVVGHRGARARFPENTLPAIRHALKAGAGGVEIDVRVSADDVLVVMHDATLPERCRLFDGRPAPAGFAVRSLSWEALRRFDCGSVADGRFPDQRAVPGTPIPSLEEVLDLLAAPDPPSARRATLFLELKREEGSPALSPPREPYARLVVDLLRRRGFADRTVVLSFDHPLLGACRDLDPSLTTAPLVDSRTDLVDLARREGAAWVGVRHPLLSAKSVAALHAAGVRVFAWTANGGRVQDRLASYGVDAVGTDDPASLVARQAARRQRPRAEAP